MPLSPLAGQVEQLLDEHTEARLDVLVRIGDAEAEPLATAASVGLCEWLLCHHPRQVLPPAVHGRPSHSVAAQVASRRVGATPLRQLRAGALAALDAAVRATPVLAQAHVTPRPLWAARSLLVGLDRDDVARLARVDPPVVEVTPNRRLRVPPVLEVFSEPDVVAGSVWGLERVGAPAVWAAGARGQGVRVGLLDTGVDPTHPDLAGKIAAFTAIDEHGIAARNAPPMDSDRHGTHVAGILVGGDASGQAIGMAPAARLVAARVLDGAAGGTDAQVLAGIDWALGENVDVINLSLGGVTFGPETPGTYSRALVTARQQGVPVVVAIGNEGAGTTGSPGNDLFALSTGAVDERDVVAGFSGGRTHLLRRSDLVDERLLPLPYRKPELTAPGVAVRSSVPGGGYALLSGTSMATPHVAGAVALLLSGTDLRERLSAPERAFHVQDLLAGTTDELGEAGLDHRYGFGRLDVAAALAAAGQR